MSHEHITLTSDQCKEIRRNGYNHAMRTALKGVVIALFIVASLFTYYVHRANQRLIDEVKATNYYYNLTIPQEE